MPDKPTQLPAPEEPTLTNLNAIVYGRTSRSGQTAYQGFEHEYLAPIHIQIDTEGRLIITGETRGGVYNANVWEGYIYEEVAGPTPRSETWPTF